MGLNNLYRYLILEGRRRNEKIRWQGRRNFVTFTPFENGEIEMMKNCRESVVNRLPKLSAEAAINAESEQSVAMIWRMIGAYPPGEVYDVGDGVILQKISIDTLRCVRVFNHFRSLHLLRFILSQCNTARVYLEIDPYTIVTPIPKATDEAQIVESQQIKEIEPAKPKQLPEKNETTQERGKNGAKKNGAKEEQGYNFGVEVV